MITLYNTLTRKVDLFTPMSPSHVYIYTCGPTVYDYMHIGNLRTFVLSDVLIRMFRYNNFIVHPVENITDIDDKIIKKAKEKEVTIEELTMVYTAAFLEDVASLNVLLNTKIVKATEHITKMIHYIEVLLEKGLAYTEDAGRKAGSSVYFDISKFPQYGKLSGLEKRTLKTGTRVLSDEYTKDDVQDFALWKAVGPDDIGYISPWGKGRPGWHIECSVMSQEYLGNTFDIHVGGIDLVFPHHENEIAQAEGKTGKPFVNYFVHGAHLLVDGKKMSKSLGNFYTLRDIVKKGYDPIALRYLFLQTHYRSEMNFTWEGLAAAQAALRKLQEEIIDWKEGEEGVLEYEKRFLEAINDDINMPQALAILWELVKSNYPTEAKAVSVFKMDEVLGLNLLASQKILAEKKKKAREKIPVRVLELVAEREKLRKDRRFHLADQIRNKIQKLGYDVTDMKGKSQITKLEE